jgi:hypothetical protein
VIDTRPIEGLTGLTRPANGGHGTGGDVRSYGRRSPFHIQAGLSFASRMGLGSRWFCQWDETTPVASHGTTVSVHNAGRRVIRLGLP